MITFEIIELSIKRGNWLSLNSNDRSTKYLIIPYLSVSFLSY